MFRKVHIDTTLEESFSEEVCEKLSIELPLLLSPIPEKVAFRCTFISVCQLLNSHDVIETLAPQQAIIMWWLQSLNWQAQISKLFLPLLYRMEEHSSKRQSSIFPPPMTVWKKLPVIPPYATKSRSILLMLRLFSIWNDAFSCVALYNTDRALAFSSEITSVALVTSYSGVPDCVGSSTIRESYRTIQFNQDRLTDNLKDCPTHL